ncbi:glycosyltransferase [Salix suchowensis]|nr:glycosyltransferase [Salix suchowensis]
MMRPYANPRSNNIWTTVRNIKKFLVNLSLVFFVCQINLLQRSPLFREKDSLPDEVFRTHKVSFSSNSRAYPYWNRTLGADHFYFSCHENEEVPLLMKNVIRLICSPSYDSECIPQKDISLPQTLELSLHDGDDVWSRSTVKSRPLMIHPEMMLPRRTKLGFWACSLNSDVRKNLLIFYKGAPEFNFHFIDKMKRAAILDAYENELYGSKFCICPRWNNHLGGVCLTESMTFGCVPVILSDYYDLPFNDVLDWNNFSVILKEEHVPNLEKILKEIPEENYKKMHQNLLQVRKHFQWNSLPVKYDLFRMVMYELWLRRHIIKY